MLGKLTQAQRERLIDLLRTHSYRETERLMWEELGVKTNHTTIRKFYGRHVAEIRSLGPFSSVPVPAAAGVAVTVICQRPGEIKFAVQPLQAGPAGGFGRDENAVCAGGVEIVAVCEREGEVRLGVYPTPCPGTASPDGASNNPQPEEGN